MVAQPRRGRKAGRGPHGVPQRGGGTVAACNVYAIMPFNTVTGEEPSHASPARGAWWYALNPAAEVGRRVRLARGGGVAQERGQVRVPG